MPRAGELPGPSESDADPFQTARKQLAIWFDQEKNRDRLKKGDTMARARGRGAAPSS